MDPKGKVALITGGARIGQVVAAALANRGCSLALTYLGSSDAAEATAASARTAGVKAAVLHADATDEAEIVAAVERDGEVAGATRHSDQHGSDLSENAESGRCALVSYPGYEREERVHVFHSCGANHETERRGADNKFLGLAAGDRASTVQGLHAILRIESFGRSVDETLALEFAPEILVNAIAPGPIAAPPNLTAEENAQVLEATPLARWGGAEEIAKTVLFFVESDFVTGEFIRVDGGRHLF